MFGFWLVLQHTPRVVTEAPPSDVILPPLVAEAVAIDVAPVVVNVAREMI